MSGQLPSRIGSARLAWSDLATAARRHPLLMAIAIIACTATSLANAYLNPPGDASVATVARGLGLAVLEPLLLTSVLLAAHRFIILGEIAETYAGSLLTARFWRFFLLSAAMVALLFVPVLLTRPFLSSSVIGLVVVAGAIAFLSATTLLALLFPAVAVDAPGASPRNAVADLWGNTWRCFWVGMLATLPLMILSMLVGAAQALTVDGIGAWARLVFAPIEGALVAATYVLLVLIASRFYLALADRLAPAG